MGYLDVDGALDVDVASGASLHIERLIVRNAGWQLVRCLSMILGGFVYKTAGLKVMMPCYCTVLMIVRRCAVMVL